MIDIDTIENTILETLEGAFVKIINPQGDGLHFEAVVVAPQFEGKTIIEQQRMVMGALKELFGSSLHAMRLQTYTPDAWEKVRS